MEVVWEGHDGLNPDGLSPHPYNPKVEELERIVRNGSNSTISTVQQDPHGAMSASGRLQGRGQQEGAAAARGDSPSLAGQCEEPGLMVLGEGEESAYLD